MAPERAIPAEMIPEILQWWLQGKSTRHIHHILVSRGVDLGSHVSVWNLLQSITD